MLRALKKQTRKRSVHPQGDTIYRAAALAAALMVLAAAPFFDLGWRRCTAGIQTIADGGRTKLLPCECVSSEERFVLEKTGAAHGSAEIVSLHKNCDAHFL